MANNRIYLRCRNCGKGFFLGKMFGGAYYTLNDYYKNKDLLTDLNDFYEKHMYCNEEKNEGDIKYLEPKFEQKNVDTENQYEIAYEFWHDDGDK